MAQGRYSYSTPVRPSDAPILDQNASASNQMSMAQFAAFDRVMQRLLGFGVDMYDRNQAKERYQTEQERLGRAEQRGIEATAEEQRRYAQQQQIAGGTREANALLKVAADPNARSAYEGRPGYEGLSQRPVVDQRFPVVPAGQDLYGQPAPAMPTEGPPEPIYGQSPLDAAQTAAYQRQRQGAFGATGALGMQIQTATDLQSVFTEIDGKTGVPGGFTQPEADDIKARLKAAFDQQLAAAKAMEEARLAIQRRAASSGSGIAPQRFTSRDLDEAAYAGDIDAYNRYRKAQGIRPLVLSNAGDKQQWEQAQARSRDMRQQKVTGGDIAVEKLHQAKFDAFAAAGDVEGAKQYAVENRIPEAFAVGAYKQGQVRAQAAETKAKPKAGPGSLEFKIEGLRRLVRETKGRRTGLTGKSRIAQEALVKEAEAELAAAEEELARGKRRDKLDIAAGVKEPPKSKIVLGPQNSISRQRVPKDRLVQMSAAGLQNILASDTYDAETKAAAQVEIDARRAAAMQPKIGRP